MIFTDVISSPLIVPPQVAGFNSSFTQEALKTLFVIPSRVSLYHSGSVCLLDCYEERFINAVRNEPDSPTSFQAHTATVHTWEPIGHISDVSIKNDLPTIRLGTPLEFVRLLVAYPEETREILLNHIFTFGKIQDENFTLEWDGLFTGFLQVKPFSPEEELKQNSMVFLVSDI
ncbi:MAG: hypothetical protein V4686_01555 [Patescibacteria group bacterium]